MVFEKYDSDWSPRIQTIAIWTAVAILPVAFWYFRTKVHCFGGDGAVGTVVSADFSIKDWLPPLPGKGRLDGYGAGFVAKCCRMFGVFDNSTVLTSILSTQIYAVVMGCIFVGTAVAAFRHRKSVFAILISAPFIFNFFGNVDNYTFSLTMGLMFFIVVSKVWSVEIIRFWQLLVLGVMWGIGMWTHPFHVFEGFVISYLFLRWLKSRWGKIANVSEWCAPVAFGLLLFTAIKVSPNGNHWFLWEVAKVPPTVSVDTFTHYLNMFLLPSLPLLVVSAIEHHDKMEFRSVLAMFGGASACFMTMAFTIGAVDQFNYQHLLFFFLMPLMLMVFKYGVSRYAAIAVVICQLSLLLPMIAVHSTDRTIERAESLYPLDPCQHNRSMSWQTHLGLCLGDNLQDNQNVKKALLRTFMNGARRAEPVGFRGGNYIYHTAFLYHFGEFEQGRNQLYQLIRQNPNVISWLLGDRSGFIYYNRKRLWADIEAFLVANNSPMLAEYRKAISNLSKKCVEHPYYLKRPKYAVTDY